MNLESPENSIKEDSNSDIEDELTVFKKFKSHLLIRLTTPKNNFLITKISDILK